MKMQVVNAINTKNIVFSVKEPKLDDFDALRNRSAELLNKIRKSWNEAEYQEWCIIQRILHNLVY